jgi:hypothetical protein
MLRRRSLCALDIVSKQKQAAVLNEDAVRIGRGSPVAEFHAIDDITLGRAVDELHVI